MVESNIKELRFSFGENWKKYFEKITDKKVFQATESLREFLPLGKFAKKTFLDIGCGSGLFSNAARSLGFKVHSFDYDKDSVECTKTCKEKYFSKDKNWKIEEGSILDEKYISMLGKFDVVYSWGVLHHTGDMSTAIVNASSLVNQNGILIFAIYNRHWTSLIWKNIKKIYNYSPLWFRKVLSVFFSVIFFFGAWVSMGHSPLKTKRGMDFYRDVIDWIGGYPYEFASVNEIKEKMDRLGFQLLKCIPTEGWTGCNEFVFRKLK